MNEIPVLKPQLFELLVKILDSSQCYSNLMKFEPNELSLKPTDLDTPPITLRHEASGIVVQVSLDCKGSAVGDEIAFLLLKKSCFYCEEC